MKPNSQGSVNYDATLSEIYAIEADMDSRLTNNFTYHPPHDGQPERYEEIRLQAQQYARLLCLYCPKSRELGLALTKLEEAVMWANAAIARNEGKES